METQIALLRVFAGKREFERVGGTESFCALTSALSQRRIVICRRLSQTAPFAVIFTID